MTRNARPGGRSTQIADLRAGVFASKMPEPQPQPKAPKPPKAPKETPDERAERAERLAMQQHTTSLLGKSKGGKPYKRAYEREEKRGGGGMFLLQLIVVIGIAGGVAFALDPTLAPVDWQNLRDTIKSWL